MAVVKEGDGGAGGGARMTVYKRPICTYIENGRVCFRVKGQNASEGMAGE